MSVTSSSPKLAWADFLQVLHVFMLGNQQEWESDITRAFDILDQGRRGLYARHINLRDGLISPDELRAFLSILTDEVIFNLMKSWVNLSLIIVCFSIVLIFVFFWLTQMDLAKLACLNSPEWSSRDWQEILSANASNRLNNNYLMNIFYENSLDAFVVQAILV